MLRLINVRELHSRTSFSVRINFFENYERPRFGSLVGATEMRSVGEGGFQIAVSVHRSLGHRQGMRLWLERNLAERLLVLSDVLA